MCYHSMLWINYTDFFVVAAKDEYETPNTVELF